MISKKDTRNIKRYFHSKKKNLEINLLLILNHTLITTPPHQAIGDNDDGKLINKKKWKLR